MTPRKRYRGFFFLLFIPLLIGALAGGVMILWNAILPDIFDVKRITYGQALGLFILCRILFGGFQFGGPHRPWKKHRRNRWSNLNQAEKDRLKEEWRRRCGR